ncbi:MAG: hypothetical protein GDA50_07715 [Alphaproteobacteria bacterium GM202ARS2]|nr:hypothetical protein [Alphaproteobacteria bacterium GM202ARS2]
MIKVTMNMTDADAENIEHLHKAFDSRSKAQAVSIALSLTRFIADQMLEPDTQILLRHAGGEPERIVMPELERLSRRTPAA